MKKVLLSFTLFLFTLTLSADPFTGRWEVKRPVEVTPEGEIVFTGEQDYEFQTDGWVKIIEPNERHEYKYEVKNRLLIIHTNVELPSTYTVLDFEEDRIIINQNETTPPYLFGDYYSPKFLFRIK